MTKIQIGHLTCWSLLTFGLHADVRADVKFVRVDVDLCMLTCMLTWNPHADVNQTQLKRSLVCLLRSKASRARAPFISSCLGRGTVGWTDGPKYWHLFMEMYVNVPFRLSHMSKHIVYEHTRNTIYVQTPFSILLALLHAPDLQYAPESGVLRMCWLESETGFGCTAYG
jgi:hypothetical protein